MISDKKSELIGQLSIELGNRENQQDCCYVDVEWDNAIAIVCDGMGGLRGGAEASQTAVQRFVEDFENVRYCLDNFYSYFCKEIILVDEIVSKLIDDRGEFLNAGTTLVAVTVHGGKMQFVSVGDSKIYVIRQNQMACMNREQNYFLVLNQKYQEGLITMEEYAAEQHMGPALISYIGMGNVSLIDANPEPFLLMDGDIIVLCSDGLPKALSEQEIFEIVTKYRFNVTEALNQLQKQAREASEMGQDNTSIVLLMYKEKIKNDEYFQDDVEITKEVDYEFSPM